MAELDGAVIAAVAMLDGRAVADIFKPTADVLRMLQDRRRQVAPASPSRALKRPHGIRQLLPLSRAERLA